MVSVAIWMRCQRCLSQVAVKRIRLGNEVATTLPQVCGCLLLAVGVLTERNWAKGPKDGHWNDSGHAFLDDRTRTGNHKTKGQFKGYLWGDTKKKEGGTEVKITWILIGCKSLHTIQQFSHFYRCIPQEIKLLSKYRHENIAQGIPDLCPRLFVSL